MDDLKGPDPIVGMGVTVISSSDRLAGTIRDVHIGGKKFWFTYDLAVRLDSRGQHNDQEYTYEAQHDAPLMEAYLNKNKRWKIRKDGRSLALGYRSAFHDYSF